MFAATARSPYTEAKDESMRNCRYLKEPMMKTVNDLNGYQMLSKSNTNCAKMNPGAPVWWLDIPLERFERDLHLLLIKERGFIWLWVKARSISEPIQQFRIRRDKGKDVAHLEISNDISNRFLHDRRNRRRFDFRPHVAGEWDDD